VAAAGITRIFPDLTDDLLLNLFHQGAQVQWTSRSLDWSTPLLLSDRQRMALARLLTPVYFGEQSAMAGASSMLPSVMAAGETTAQLYLATFIMDEARHFEALTRLYRSLGHDPLRIRDMPELLRYYHRLREGDRMDWVWGILISDIIGKHFYRALGPQQATPDPLFGTLTVRILRDESRHLAFAEHYLKRNLPALAPERRRMMVEMRDELMQLLESMTRRVRDDALASGVEIDDFLADVGGDIDGVARRVGLLERTSGPPRTGSGLTISEDSGRRPPLKPATDAGAVMARCFGCLLSLICGRPATA
jgi:hypothetical protein